MKPDAVRLLIHRDLVRRYLMAGFVGAILGAAITLPIHWALDSWRSHHDGQLRAEAHAKVNRDLAVAKLALADAIRMSGGTEDVDDVLRIKAQWLDAQVARR